MAKEKKKLTVKQQQKKYRVLQFTCLGGEIISILTPFITLGAVNYEKWFKTENGWQIGLGAALALALLGIAIYLFTKKKEKEDKSITNGWLTLIIGWFAVAFVFVLLTSIMDQIATIMLFGGIGLMAAFGLDMESQALKKKADTLKEIIGDVEVDNFKEKAKAEYEKEIKEKEEESQPTE